jgi:hypothetical protein
MTRRTRGTKQQVKGPQGSASRPNPLTGWQHFELVQAET